MTETQKRKMRKVKWRLKKMNEVLQLQKEEAVKRERHLFSSIRLQSRHFQ